MVAHLPTLERKLEARNDTVEELVDRARRGLIRVPRFQRGLRWGAGEVVALFDSVYRGYPIGSLLLWQRPAPAARVELGPLIVHAPETATAWWVVDGQQRLTALAASLARPTPIPDSSDDPHVIYFDPRDRRFARPPRHGTRPEHWVPVTQLFDASRLSEWVLDWKYGRDRSLRSALFDAGKRLREYRVPFYVVDTEDEGVLKEIFYRINNSGKRLEWSEVHDALYDSDDTRPGTLDDLGAELSRLGMGRPDRNLLLRSIMAVRGLDVTRTLAEHRSRDRDVLDAAAADSLPVLRRVLAFLRDSAEVPHLRLLPLSAPFVVLARYFAEHPEPTARLRTLLTRFVWRSWITRAMYDDRTLQRRGVSCVSEDAEASVQALLRLVAAQPGPPFVLPERFDARHTSTRIALLALASLRPCRLDDGSNIDVAVLINSRDRDAFRRIVGYRSAPALTGSPANRILLPGSGPGIDELVECIGRVTQHQVEQRVLASHAIERRAAESLLAGNFDSFVNTRARTIEAEVAALGDRLAGWSQSDRPSIAYILNQTEAQP